MIADLGYPATLVALFFSLPLLVSPVRIWIGYHSDGHAIFGRRREPYSIGGALVIGLGVIASTVLITSGGSAAALIGVARSRAARLYEVATMVGMVLGAGLIKRLLKVYDPAKSRSAPRCARW